MKKLLLMVLLSVFCVKNYSQERFLTYTSKDTINGEPKVKGSIGVNLKFNGYYDFFGGLQNSETFNVGAINVFGTDDTQSLNVDLYQSQIKLESTVMTKKGQKVNAVVEFDFWGGNGKMRLRKAYVELKNWLVGQTWVPFGDYELWPNILENEGPPSGVWVRAPQISYFNTFNNKNWQYTLALVAPITDYDTYGELEPVVNETNQTTPDFSLAFKYKNPWGHIKFTSIFRNVHYEYLNEKDNFFGYGFAVSGIYKQNVNNLQFQFTGGKGVSAYNTSVQGYGYDGYPTATDGFKATPSYGGWASYEYFYTPKFHSTLVIGYTRYYLDNAQRLIITNPSETNLTLINGNIDNSHYYGILNLLFDPIENMVVGVELNYGNKKLSFDGDVNDEYIDDSKARDAMRISFGVMYSF